MSFSGGSSASKAGGPRTPRGRSAPASKFGNRRCQLDGVSFASRAEAKRYAELRVLERAGVITGLRLQPRFPLVVGGLLVCTYVGDFAYCDSAGASVVEDVKSPATRTPVYVLKTKLLLALHGIPVVEVMA